MRKLEQIFAVITLISLIIAWIIGWQNSKIDIDAILQKSYSESELVLQITDIYTDSENQNYFVVGSSDGYGGPMQICVQYDSSGVIKNVKPLVHKETIAFFQKVEANNFLNLFPGISSSKTDSKLRELDVISGATFTCNAINYAVQDATNKLAFHKWKIPPRQIESKDFSFGLKEITLLGLFLLSLLLFNTKLKFKKHLRFLIQVLSIIILGFVTTTMMSIVHVNSLLMLYFPKPAVNLAWYILIAIVFLPILIKRKNYYCNTICPFGATQEMLGKIGKAKPRIPANIRKHLIWLPRILAWFFIILALISNNPGIKNHEVFSAFFRLTGSDYLFAIVAVVLILSTFISKPWCNYLCPIRGTTDYVEFWTSMRFKKSDSDL